jgi:uncharacterized protein (DUF433 family)
MASVEIFPGVISDPEIMGGKPVIKGRRIPVSLIIGKLAGGMSKDELLDEFDLTEEQVRAALIYAEELIEARDNETLGGKTWLQ